MNCRYCRNKLKYDLIDLNFAPPSNAYISKDKLSVDETYYPLRVKVCDKCFLVQTEDYVKSNTSGLFDEDYAYFSSTSKSFLDHAKKFCDYVEERFKLDKSSFVIEVASNDGYLLKNFLQKEIPCLGIEPTLSTANASRKIGLDVIDEFFGEVLASKLKKEEKECDLIIGNNVYAHVPDILDFTKGLKTILKKEGVVSLEFPHLLELIKHCQFDTIYHEHFSYLSLNVVKKIFESAGLRVFDVEKIKTHGGSLRVFGCKEDSKQKTSIKVIQVINEEKELGLNKLKSFEDFSRKAEIAKYEALQFLIDCKKNNKQVYGYGAAAKGNTFLNYAGIKSDLVRVVFDAAKSKQDKYLPGSHIPIKSSNDIENYDIDFMIVFPWNIISEISKSLEGKISSKTKLVTFIPKLTIHK